MGFWTNKEHRTGFDEAEDLAYPPGGGRVTMWLLGVGVALIPIGYGIRCLVTGHAVLWGQNNSALDVTGSTAVALAITYIAVGVFIHAHWFWGLQPKRFFVSSILKFLTVLVFLVSLGYVFYKVVAT